MNLDNRRLREIQQEKKAFKTLLETSKTIEDSLCYQGKLDILEEEEKQILERNDVVI